MMEERKVLAKIVLPIEVDTLVALGECFPTGAIVEAHGDELWILSSSLAEVVRRRLRGYVESQEGRTEEAEVS